MHPFRNEPLHIAQRGPLGCLPPPAAPEQPPPQGPAGTAWHSRRASLPSGLRRPEETRRRDPGTGTGLNGGPTLPHGGATAAWPSENRRPLRPPATRAVSSAERLPSPVEAGLTARGRGSRRRNAVPTEPPHRGARTDGRLSGIPLRHSRKRDPSAGSFSPSAPLSSLVPLPLLSRDGTASV